MTDSTDPRSTGDEPTDPTAPPWTPPEPAPPTQPIPTEPPVAQPSPYAPPAPDPYPAAPPDPYGQAPYGQMPYAQNPYGETPNLPQQADPAPYGQAYSQSPYAPSPYGSPFAEPPRPGASGSSLALTIVSAVATVLCCLFCLPSLILGIVALSRQSTDPASSARLTRYGWIGLGIALALSLLAIAGFIAVAASGGFDTGGTSDYEGL
jgi:hypothetical protein